MKLILFFLILTLSLSSSLTAKDLLVHATAKIIEGNVLNAQKQALKNVIYEAIKKSVENLMDLKIIKKNYGVIRNQIYNFSENFITNFEVINEEKDLNQNLYKISILANVNKERIRKKLKELRILEKKKERKRVLLLYYSSTTKSFRHDSEIVKEINDSVQKSFDENSFLTFDSQTMNDIYMYIEEEKIIGESVDSFISLALIFNADILVLMQMSARQMERFNESFYKISANIHFSIYDTLTGQQIAETKVNSFESSVNIVNKYELDALIKKAGKHAGMESVRQAVSHIISYYQNLGFFLHEYSVIFSNYSPQQERLIIDYFENDFSYRKLSELKNSFRYLELGFFSKKRKGILRRKVISDLLKHKIEIATKSLAGNRITFINPNLIDEINDSDNFSKDAVQE